jgi:hypothetical protein
MAVVCNAALWIVVPHLSGIVAPLSISGIIFMEVGTGMVSMALTTKYVRAFAKPHSPVRTVSLAPTKRTLPGGYLPFAGPMIIVGLGFFLLLTRRGIPFETYRGAMSLLILPLISNAFYLWVAWMATFRMRQIHSGDRLANAESADRRMGYILRLLIAYVMTVFWVYGALAIAKITPMIKGIGPLVLLFSMWFAVVALIGVYFVRRRKEGAEAVGEPVGDTTPDANWKGGLIYYNPADPALVVETRAGQFGCDLNFGNKWSLAVCAVILATPFVLLFLWF